MRTKGALSRGPDHLEREKEQRQLTLARRFRKNDIVDKGHSVDGVLVARWNVPSMSVLVEDDIQDYLDHERGVCQKLDHPSAIISFQLARVSPARRIKWSLKPARTVANVANISST